MGVVLEFRHALTRSRKAKTDSAGRLPVLSSTLENRKKSSGGMLPRIFQLETPCRLTPASLAAAFGPPTAAITSATVLSMPQHNIHSVYLSSVHDTSMENLQSMAPNTAMDSDQIIGERLRSLRKHFGIGRESQEVFGRRFGVEKTAWSNYENGHRPVPVDLADRLCRDLGVSMDWLYRGNGVAMPPRLLQTLLPTIRKQA